MKIFDHTKPDTSQPSPGRYLLLPAIALVLLASCKKADYLDSDNADRPTLSAKVKLVNALNTSGAVNFLDFTRQITTSAVARNASTAYLATQFGKVQYNTTEGSNSSYKSSYLFGGAASFSQETDKASFAGPNGPIADFYHSLFTVAKRKPSKANPGNRDSLILVYDDLDAPVAGKAKVRFANFSPDAPNLSLGLSGSAATFTNVAYGNFADQTIITYDANGKAPATIPGLTWRTLGPFKEVNPAAGQVYTIRNSTTNAVIAATGLSSVTFEAGKIYTLYINGTIAAGNLSATIITHTK